MKKMLLFSCIVLQGFACVAQSDCWETGSCAYGLLEPGDLVGVQAVQMRSYRIRARQRRIAEWKTTVQLDALGHTVELQEIELCEKSPRFYHHVWEYSGDGTLVQEYTGIIPGKPLTSQTMYQNLESGVVKKTWPCFHQSVSEETFHRDTTGRILHWLIYALDTIRKDTQDMRSLSFAYDSLGRLSSYDYTTCNGSNRYTLRYDQEFIYVTIDVGDPAIQLREEIQLDEKGLPTRLTTLERRGRRWVATHEVVYAYAYSQ